MATRDRADAVGFGVDVVGETTAGAARFEKDLQPELRVLDGSEILGALFPPERLPRGQIWRYLWAASVLRTAHAVIPRDTQLVTESELPIVLLALGYAQKYASLPDRLYRHFFQQERMDGSVKDRESYEICLAAVDSIDVIDSPLRRIAARSVESESILAVYRSARLATVSALLRQAISVEDRDLQAECLSMLIERVGASDVLLSGATFPVGALQYLAHHRQLLTVAPRNQLKTVMLRSVDLSSGGVQAVVVAQARDLQRAGYRVIVAVGTMQGSVHTLPAGIELVELGEGSRGAVLRAFYRLCIEQEVDYVIDHYILYNNDWPFFALMGHALGIRTAGWLHSFALRPVHSFNRRTSFLTTYLPLLDRVVTLSAADVEFWKSRGIEQAVYLPNPASPWLLERPIREEPRRREPTDTLRLVWWGRLQEDTKRLRSLIDVAAELQKCNVDFELVVIGPDSYNLTAVDLRDYATEKGVSDRVKLPGPLHDHELMQALEQSDMYVCTSAIEGYLLALVEAQSLGLPVAMYELPWLEPVQGNSGLVTARQGDARGLARVIADAVSSSTRYEELSRGSLQAADRALAHDHSALYAQLLDGELSADYAPEPTRESMQMLLDQAIRFHEENVDRQRDATLDIQRDLRRARQEQRRLKEIIFQLRTAVSDHEKEERRLKTLVLRLRTEKQNERQRRIRYQQRIAELESRITYRVQRKLRRLVRPKH